MMVMMVMSPAAEPSGCQYVTKPAAEPSGCPYVTIYIYIYIYIYSEKILKSEKGKHSMWRWWQKKINKTRNGCAQSTDYLNTSFQMMVMTVMSPAAEPSGCPYVTKLQP